MKFAVVFSLLCVMLHAKDLYPFHIGEPHSFTGAALDSFNYYDSIGRAAVPIWKKVYEQGVPYESLIAEEKELMSYLDTPEGPDALGKSIYDISDELFLPNCDAVAYSKNLRASSTLKASSKFSYDISNIHDADLSTAWVEGEDGYGIGTRIYFTPDVTSWVRESYLKGKSSVRFTIHLFNGYVKSPSAWRNNSRVKKALIGVVDGGIIGTLHIADTMGLQSFSVHLPAEVLAKECYFEIVDVYKGDKWADVAISEFHFHDPGCCLAPETVITMSDSSGKTIKTISIGDTVLTLDEKGGAVPAAVLGLISTPHDNCYDISFDDLVLTITDDHPIRLSDGSWGTIRGGASPYLRGEGTKKLSVGDILSHQGGSVKIIGITAVNKTIETFTITKLSHGSVFFANGVEVAVESVNR